MSILGKSKRNLYMHCNSQAFPRSKQPDLWKDEPSGLRCINQWISPPEFILGYTRIHSFCYGSPTSCCAQQCSLQHIPANRQVCPQGFSCGALGIWVKHNITVHVVSTWVSGPVPGCSTAQVRACFPLRQQLPGCLTPTTPPYLKMHLYFQQLLVELRVLHDMVSMANTLGLQDINCLESTGKPLRAPRHSSAPACPETPSHCRYTPH